MGDFVVDANTLRATIGVETVPCDLAALRSLLPAPDDREVESELAADSNRFAPADADRDAHRRSVRVGLAVRRWAKRESLSAFTMNFLAFDRASGLPTVPFLEASKAMARGVGYAGEGDVLTAALVGALASVHSATTFTEMFCPDWQNDSIFLSHMGEVNLNLTAERPALRKYPFPWSDADDPVVAVGRLRAGEAALVNLAPGPGNAFTLIVAPVTMLEVTGEDRMHESVHGWFRPALAIPDFLAAYSRAGGTHHSALVYGPVAREIAHFGALMGWRVVILDSSGA